MKLNIKLRADQFWGIGLSRTCTDSLYNAFRLLGIDSIHMPNIVERNDLDKYKFANDIPITTRYKELDKKFPNSKFIYTIRDVDKWIKSCRNFWASMDEVISFAEKNWDHPVFKDNCRIFGGEMMRAYGQLRFDEDVFRRVYEQHDKDVKDYFRNRQDDLLTMDISNGDGWEKLIPFVTDEEVDMPRLFPWTNSTGAWWDQNLILPTDTFHNKNKCLATVCDKNFLPGMETMLSSFIRNTPTFRWDIVVLSPDMTEDDLGRIASMYPFVRLIKINTDRYDVINKKLMEVKPGANGAYYKYEVFGLDEYERILFLDSDTLTLQDSWELLNCKEDIAMSPELFIDQFNTGVMSIDKKYLGQHIVRKLIKLTEIVGPTDHVDQDIINLFFEQRIKPLPIEFNFLKIYHNYSFMGELSPHIKILHYVINKPWKSYTPLLIENGCGWLDKYWHNERKKFIDLAEAGLSFEQVKSKFFFTPT